MKIWLLGLAVMGLTGLTGLGACHDASQDLQRLAARCDACDKDTKLTPEAKQACAARVIDDLVTYIKATPSPRGDERNAGAQWNALASCAVKLGVDVNAKTKGL